MSIKDVIKNSVYESLGGGHRNYFSGNLWGSYNSEYNRYIHFYDL